MAFSITGQIKVETLKKRFHKEFGLTLRVYDGRSFADEGQTIGQIRKKKGSGDLSIKKNMKVGTLEEKIESEFGIKVQIAGSDDSYLCDNDLTLASAHEKDEKKVNKKNDKSKSVKSNLILTSKNDEFSADKASENSINKEQMKWLSHLENLQNAPEHIISNKEFMLKVLCENGLLLKHASQDLKKDEEIIRAACEQDSYAIEYANINIEEDLFESGIDEFAMEIVSWYINDLKKRYADYLDFIDGVECGETSPKIKKGYIDIFWDKALEE
jgi:hypothetical protein